MSIAPPPWPPSTGPARAVALEVLLHGPLSRSEIARRLELSQGSLTRLSGPLIEAGLLVEQEEQLRGRAGRPSRPLDLVADARHFIGIKLTGEEALGVVTDLRATVLASAVAPLRSHEPDDVVGVVADLVEQLSAHAPAITAIGIGIGGLVKDYTHVESAPFLEWTDVSLGPMLESRVGVPTVVENDLTAVTEAEHWFGAGRGLDRFAVLTVGAAVGYGAVVHNTVLTGPDSGIGLVGHWPVEPLGPPCPNGHRGCAQSLMTVPAIATAVSYAHGREISYDECLELAAEGDPAARRVIDDAGNALGRLIAAVANLIVPQRVIIGGEGVGFVSLARPAMLAGIAQDRDPRASDLDVHTASADVTTWCRGAAVIAIQTYVLGVHPWPDGDRR